MLRKLAGIGLLFISIASFGQKKAFTHADTLRGSITPEREWWDLNYYHLSVRPNDKDSSLTGSTVITYKVLKPYQTMQVDLQEPLQITKVIQAGEALSYRRDGNAFFITLSKKQETGKTESIEVFYAGKPRLAKRPPWDGGVQ